MSDLVNHPIFICGTIRSGTTLLMALLDGHPQLLVNPSESHFFLQVLPLLSNNSTYRSESHIRDLLLELWHPDNMYRQKFLSHVPIETVKNLYDVYLENQGGTAHPSAYLEAAILAYGQASRQVTEHSRSWVEKTPYNEQFVPLIYQWWTQAKCIHMIRDPRDFLLTLYNRAWKRERSVPHLDAVAESWQRSTWLLQENQRRYGTERYMLMRYEDLVTMPDQEVKRLAEFLGISNDSILAKPTKGGGFFPWKGNAVSTKFDGISSDRVGLWRQGLNERDLVILEMLLQEEMKQLGYERITHTSPQNLVVSAPYQLLLVLRRTRARLKRWFLLRRMREW